MYCMKCGAQIPDEAVFCPKCGARTGADAPAAQPVQPVYTPQQQNYAPPAPAPAQRMASPYVQPAKKSGGFFKKIIAAILIIAVIYFVWPAVREKIEEFTSGQTESGQEGSISYSGDSSNSGNTGNSGNSSTGSSGSSDSSGSQSGPASSGNSGSSDSSSGSSSSSAYQDVGTVTFDDFNVVHHYMVNGMPTELVTLAPYEALGNWKYGFGFEDDDLTYYEIGTCTIDIGQDYVTLTLSPTMAHDGNAAWELSPDDVGYTTMTGTMYDDEISFSSSALTIVIGNFRCDESDSYAFGKIISGQREGYIMLTRSAF